MQYDVPLKHPSERHHKTIKNHPMAVIVGGGPGGLLSALALNQTRLYSAIYIIEKRSTFSRQTAFNLRPQCFLMFKKLGVLDQFIKTSCFVPSLRFHQTIDNQLSISEEKFDGFDDAIDYTLPLNILFKGYGWPHHAIKINDFEKALSDMLCDLENIYFLQGTAEIKDDDIHHSASKNIQFKSNNIDKIPDLFIEKPELIVVAEGARSPTRDALVGSYEITNREKEHWFTAAISLENIQPIHIENNFTVLEDQPQGRFNIAAWLPQQNEMLINGNILYQSHCAPDIELYIKDSGYKVLNMEKKYLNINIPDSHQDLLLNRYNDFVVKFLRAKKFFYGDNLIFAGDAAGVGSPLGGYGITLLGSVYADALMKLSHELRFCHVKENVLNKYAEKVSDIISYWHSI